MHIVCIYMLYILLPTSTHCVYGHNSHFAIQSKEKVHNDSYSLYPTLQILIFAICFHVYNSNTVSNTYFIPTGRVLFRMNQLFRFGFGFRFGFVFEFGLTEVLTTSDDGLRHPPQACRLAPAGGQRRRRRLVAVGEVLPGHACHARVRRGVARRRRGLRRCIQHYC